jgi:tetratricopeptide (TPR) repeat protein
MKKGNNLRLLAVLLAAAFVVTTVASTAMAFKSEKKTPQEQAAENERNATKAYNDGVNALDAGNQAGASADSAYAFNYRAAPDAKARKQYEKAVDKFKKAVGLKPDMPESWNNLGYCYRKLGKLDASLQAYDKALELKKDFAQAYEYRGETFLALGQLDKAQADLDMLHQLKSSYADVLAKSIEVYQLEKVKGAEHSSTSKW